MTVAARTYAASSNLAGLISDVARLIALGYQPSGDPAMLSRGMLVQPMDLDDAAASAVTATANGLTTGLIPASASYVVATSANAAHQISLPAAEVGKEIKILVVGAACELISAVAAHQVNEVVVGATNEAALVQDALYTCKYVAANKWIVTGETKLGARIAAIVPDAL
jgi:hypothetical protein